MNSLAGKLGTEIGFTRLKILFFASVFQQVSALCSGVTPIVLMKIYLGM